MSPQEPYVPGSSVTILPGVPLQGTGQQDNESSAAREDQNETVPAADDVVDDAATDTAFGAPTDLAPEADATEFAAADEFPSYQPESSPFEASAEFTPADYTPGQYAPEVDEPAGDNLFQSAGAFAGYGAPGADPADEIPATWSAPLAGPVAATESDASDEEFRLDPLFASATTLPTVDEVAHADEPAPADDASAAAPTDYSRYNMYSGYPDDDASTDTEADSRFAVSAHAVDEVLAAIGATGEFAGSVDEPHATDGGEPHVEFPPLVPTDEVKAEAEADADSEGRSLGSPFGRKAAIVGAIVVAAAAGWFGHGATSSSSQPAAPVVTHHAVLVTPASELTTMGSNVALKQPTVLDAQRALMKDLTSTRETPVFFGTKDVPGAYAQIGVLTGALSPHGKKLGTAYPAVGGGTVRCGEYSAAGHRTDWCTWSDGKTSGVLANFSTDASLDNTYADTELLRSQMEA